MGRKERRKAERQAKKGGENLDKELDRVADRYATSFGAMVDQVKAEAAEEGLHGVMIIATESAHVCDLVPPGKIWQAGSQEVHDKRMAERQ